MWPHNYRITVLGAHEKVEGWISFSVLSNLKIINILILCVKYFRVKCFRLKRVTPRSLKWFIVFFFWDTRVYGMNFAC